MVGSSTFGAPQKLQSAAVVGKMAAYQKMAAMFHACILTMQICRRYCMSSIYPCSIVQETAKASRIRRWEEERKRCKTKRKTSCWIPSLVMHLQGVLWNLNDAGPLKTVSINSRNLEQNYLVNLLMLFSNVRNDVIWSLIWRRGERYTWLRRRKQQPRSAPRHAALVLLRRAKSFNIVNRMGTEEVETRRTKNVPDMSWDRHVDVSGRQKTKNSRWERRCRTNNAVLRFVCRLLFVVCAWFWHLDPGVILESWRKLPRQSGSWTGKGWWLGADSQCSRSASLGTGQKNEREWMDVVRDGLESQQKSMKEKMSL